MIRKDGKAKLGVLERAVSLERGIVDENRRVSFSAASEEPYRRYSWDLGEYLEVLDLSPKSVRMGRMQDGAPLLKDHRSDQQIGKIEEASIVDRKLRVTARFGNSDAAKLEALDVQDGIRTKVSVGYLVHEMVLEKQSEDGPDVYRVTDWEPLEVSTVAIPADPTVGFGRAEAGVAFRDHEARVIRRETRQEASVMEWIQVYRREDGVLLRIKASEFDSTLHEKVEERGGAPAPAPSSRPAVRSAAAPTEVDPEVALKGERDRVAEILALGAKWNQRDKAEEAIKAGVPWQVFRDHVWSQQPAGKPLEEPKTQLGLSEREVKDYSILRAVRALVMHDRSAAKFELECSREIAERLGRAPQGFWVPADMLYSQAPWAKAQRDLSVGTPTAGGNLKATDLRAQDFITLLRNRSIINRLGARVLPGLVGDVAIPRQSGGATASWVAESGTTSESDATFDQVTMAPKTLCVRTDITRKLMLQATPAAEGIVRDDLATAIALGIDSAGFNGSGSSNQPRGVRNVSGIGSVALGTNGGAPTWAAVVKLVQLVKAANADINTLGFAINANVWGTLLTTVKVSGQPNYILSEPGDVLLGRRIEVSEQVPSNLTKGTASGICSAMFYGNWNDLLIGEWGTLDLFPDPYTNGDQNGLVLRAFQDVDVAVRHPASFAVTVDMLTN